MRIKDDVWVYVEGGGSGAGSSDLQAECRRAFAEFFSKTVLGTTRRPRVVPCGGREQALDMFCTAIRQKKNALLLVDSETPVAAVNRPDTNNCRPWAHLREQANWQQPARAQHDDCQLMVQCTESWFLADWDAVGVFFGRGFRKAVLLYGDRKSVV